MQNLLPRDKIVDKSTLKPFRNDKSRAAQIMLLKMVENTVGKGENAGDQHFLLFPQCFQKA